jgi:hypothetical protein
MATAQFAQTLTTTIERHRAQFVQAEQLPRLLRVRQALTRLRVQAVAEVRAVAAVIHHHVQAVQVAVRIPVVEAQAVQVAVAAVVHQVAAAHVAVAVVEDKFYQKNQDKDKESSLLFQQKRSLFFTQ